MFSLYWRRTRTICTRFIQQGSTYSVSYAPPSHSRQFDPLSGKAQDPAVFKPPPQWILHHETAVKIQKEQLALMAKRSEQFLTAEQNARKVAEAKERYQAYKSSADAAKENEKNGRKATAF